MNNRKTNFFEKVFYSNKFLMVFSLLLAIILWAIVKANYSETTTRVITDVKVDLDTSLAQENDYMPFYDADDLNVAIEVSGRSYNINTYSLKHDDISIEATSGYIDAAGYKTLYLTAHVEGNDIEVVKITPSFITVFFDRSATETFNVEARVLNDSAKLENEGYIIGQPVPSEKTVDITGPVTVLAKINKVFFDAKLNNDQLPLTSTVSVDAAISYDLDHERENSFLVCENVGTGGSKATVTIPVNRVATVETSVKFVNQPAYFDENPPKVTISPAQVKLSYNADETEEPTTYNNGTVDFHTLQNKVNTQTFERDEKNMQLIDEVSEFKVSIDLSSFSSIQIDATKSNVVFLNQQSDYKYTASLDDVGLDKVLVIGPAASLKKITPEDLQIEINVSSLTRPSSLAHAVKITNISIQSEDVNDCWISGNYRARVSMTAK